MKAAVIAALGKHRDSGGSPVPWSIGALRLVLNMTDVTHGRLLRALKALEHEWTVYRPKRGMWCLR